MFLMTISGRTVEEPKEERPTNGAAATAEEPAENEAMRPNGSGQHLSLAIVGPVETRCGERQRKERNPGPSKRKDPTRSAGENPRYGLTRLLRGCSVWLQL